MAINPQPGGATGIVCILLLVAVPAAWADLVLAADRLYGETPH